AQVQMLEEYDYKPCTSLRSYNPPPKLSVSQIEEAAELLNKAEKPLIIVGQGVIISKAEQKVLELAEKIGAPIASSLMALSAIPSSHPQYIGMVGMHGSVAANVMSQESDTILAIGMRFSDRVTGDIKRYAPKAKIIHIDIDNSEINKVVNSFLGIHADALTAVDELIKHTTKASHASWFDVAKKAYKREYDLVIKKSIHANNETLQMGGAINSIAEYCKGNAIIVTDVGQQQMYAARYSKFNHSRSFITSGGLGTMGYGLPAAIGAKLGQPTKDVIAILGDGGFQMTMQELGTIAHNNIAVKIVILNNSFLGMVRQWQQLFYNRRYSFTELQNPDFSVIASAYGIKSEKVYNEEQLQSAIDRMFKHEGSYLLDVIVDKEENVFPMVPAGKSISEQICNE
ncbi:MAG: thiamine pyrophosphate-binding protein, partial [Rikenellaceae bacterium]